MGQADTGPEAVLGRKDHEFSGPLSSGFKVSGAYKLRTLELGLAGFHLTRVDGLGFKGFRLLGFCGFRFAVLWC